MRAPRQIRLDNADPATVRTVRRFDLAGELRSPYRRKSDGALCADGVVVSECVLVYRKTNGDERRELVTRQAVLDTAKTIARASTTLNHPPGGFVTKANADRLSTGGVDGSTTLTETAQGSYATVSVTLRRGDAIDAYEDGTATALSAGYDVTLDETPGVHPVFGRYDAAQIGRDCNHLAQVPKGRDPSAELRTDADDAYQVSTWQPPEQTTDTPAGNVRNDSPEVSMTPKLLALLSLLGVGRFDSEDVAIDHATVAVEKLRADKEEAETKAATMEEEKKDAPDFEAMKKERDQLKKDNEGLQGKIDAFELASKKEKEDRQDAADAAELTELQELAGTMDVRHDGLDLPKLQWAIAKKHLPTMPDDANASFVGAVLAMARADAATPKGSGSRWSGNSNRTDTGDAGDDMGAGKRSDARPFGWHPDAAAGDKARNDSIAAAGGAK